MRCSWGTTYVRWWLWSDMGCVELCIAALLVPSAPMSGAAEVFCMYACVYMEGGITFRARSGKDEYLLGLLETLPGSAGKWASEIQALKVDQET